MIIAMIVIAGVFIVLNRISKIRTYCSGIPDNSSCVTDDYQSSTQAYYKYDDNRVNTENK